MREGQIIRVSTQGTTWGYSGNYDLCLDVTKLGVDGVVAMVELYVERMGYAGDK